MTSESTDILEDEAYDPWPGCIMDRTGCHGQSYYTMKYEVNEQLISFFNFFILLYYSVLFTYESFIQNISN